LSSFVGKTRFILFSGSCVSQFECFFVSMKIPETTSAESFERFVGGKLLRVSVMTEMKV